MCPSLLFKFKTHVINELNANYLHFHIYTTWINPK